MPDAIIQLKKLKPQLDIKKFNLDVIRLDRIAFGDAMSLAEKILSYEQAEFYVQGHMVCSIYTQGHQSQDEFDELFMRTTRAACYPGMAYRLDLIPFSDGNVQSFFLQYKNLIVKNIVSRAHNDSRSGYELRAEILGLSGADGENLIDTSQDRDASTFVLEVFEPKLHQEVLAHGNRTKTYRIISAK